MENARLVKQLAAAKPALVAERALQCTPKGTPLARVQATRPTEASAESSSASPTDPKTQTSTTSPGDGVSGEDHNEDGDEDGEKNENSRARHPTTSQTITLRRRKPTNNHGRLRNGARLMVVMIPSPATFSTVWRQLKLLPPTTGTSSLEGTVQPHSNMLREHNKNGTEPPTWLLELLLPTGDEQAHSSERISSGSNGSVSPGGSGNCTGNVAVQQPRNHHITPSFLT